MRAKEFIKPESDINEIAIAPAIAAIGSALARAGPALMRKLKPAGQALGKMVGKAADTAVTTAATSFGQQAGTNLANKLTGQTTQTQKPLPPVKFPPGTTIEPAVSNDPNKLAFNVGGATLSLDLKDPANQKIIQQLGSVMPAGNPTKG